MVASCGYRWEPDFSLGRRPSIYVPFVEGDEEGRLTASIIRALARSGLVDVVQGEGDYRLQVAIVETRGETIGFRRDPQQIKGETRKQLLACEARKAMAVEATVFEGSSDQIVYGPYRIGADVDYDYVDGDSLSDLAFLGPDGQQVVVLPFSLGQLESNEAAQEAAARPLFAQIAQKIVDAIVSEW